MALMTPSASLNSTSKLAVPVPGKYWSRHSMKKWRSGAVPVVVV